MDNSQETLQKQRAKRKRVARMKKTIIMTVASWMILSILAMVFLCIKIASLQRQINILASQYAEQSIVETKEVDADVEDENLEGLYSSLDNLDNLAEAGDIPRVYLTFDDGPSENSNEILDILDDYNVKATFFVVGKEDEESLEVYKRIVDEGHTIGMHSFSHKYTDIYESREAFENDLNRISDLIYDTTGVRSKYFRFPGGSSNQVSNTDMSVFIKYLNDNNITYYDWNVASGDATSQAFTPDELVENVTSDVVKYKTSVVLMHDASNKDATVQALPDLIESLQALGAMILPISEDTTVIQHMGVAH